MSSILGDMSLAKGKGRTYAKLYRMTALVHLIYMIIFLVANCKKLSLVNVGLVVFYLIISMMITNVTHYGTIFVICTIAMTLFLSSHYIMLGPSFGFQYLSIGMIPLMFYLVYVNGAGVEIARNGSIASYILFCIVSFACAGIQYPLVEVNELARRVIVVLNLTLTFFLSIRFMTEFVKSTFRETGRLANRNSDLEQSANVDALTGLLNRRSVETHIDSAIKRARGSDMDLAFLMCDIDNFKRVNDTYGHDCGDLVLKQVALILKSEVRPEDAVFRWGGEEILIIVNAGGYIAKRVAERCRRSVEKSSITYNDQEIKVTITIGGIAYYQGATRDDLISRADKNLYEGKQNGKNQVVM